MNDNKFEHVKGTGHYGKEEFYHLNVDSEKLSKEINEASEQKIFTNPECLKMIREGKVQLIGEDGTPLSSEEIEEAISKYQQEGRRK